MSFMPYTSNFVYPVYCKKINYNDDLKKLIGRDVFYYKIRQNLDHTILTNIKYTIRDELKNEKYYESS